MILVLTGFSYHPFDRLVKAMDEIAGRMAEEILIQKGSSKVEIVYAKSFDWDSYERIEELIKSAGIIVCHAGVGTLLDCKRNEKQMIVVPRRKEFGESFDNHQEEIAIAMSNKGSGRLVENVADLEGAIREMMMISHKPKGSSNVTLPTAIRDLLTIIERENTS